MCVHDIYIYTYTRVHAYTRIYILNTYTFYQYILCKNCTKITLKLLEVTL